MRFRTTYDGPSWVRIAAVGAVAATTILAAPVDAAPPERVARAGFDVDVVSSRAEYVSGGDARIRIAVPRNVPLHQVTVTAGGSDVTSAFTADRNERTLEGVVDGLPLGTSTVHVTANGNGKGRPSTSISVTNHAIQGPMFSGPHQTPFICETEESGLGPALDDDCSAPTQVQFLYGSTAGGFAPLPADSRPSDMATATTTTGVEVDYIVRLETGVINRAVYQTAVLYDPSVADTDAAAATPGWNGRLVYSYGGGCNAGYHQGRGNGGVLSDLHLSRGYATASSSLNVLDNNCNDVLSAETTSMVKEHFIETYGADEHTIGWGGSGGAISQHLIGQNYPGLLDGIVPTLSYPDASTIFSGIADCRLIDQRVTGGEITSLNADALREVTGYQSYGNCLAWSRSFSNRAVADEGCPSALPAALRYDAVTNPDGARCTVTDHLVNILGINPATGVAYTLYDNVGVQYGLEALNDGAITAEQFLEVNEAIGGLDTDGHLMDARTDVDPTGLERAYSTGRVVNGGGGLSTMPIIDVRPYLDPFSDIHTRFHSFSVRERLIETNGNADNQVIQIAGDFGSFNTASGVALAAMDEWLTNIDGDRDERTAADVAAAKPASLVDGCWNPAGEFIAEPATYQGDSTCNDLYPSYAEPRLVAGAPVVDDVFKCALQPLDVDAYAVEFTAQQEVRLTAIFPNGVCDYAAPGVGQVPLTGTWLAYGN